MKKSFKFISSITMLLITIITIVFTSNTKVNAATYGINSDKVLYTDSTYGTVKVSKEGAITITYKYGFTELLIGATKCVSYNYEGTGTNRKKVSCNSFGGIESTTIIHLSGAANTQSESASKTIHLFDHFEYEEIVKIEIVTSFMTETIGCTNDDSCYKDQYQPRYSNPNIFENGCIVNDAKCVSGRERVKDFIVDKYRINKEIVESSVKEIIYKDKNRLILKGPNESLDNNYVGEHTYVQVENSKFSSANEDTNELIFETIIPTLIGALVVVAAVTLVMLGYQIVKSSDDPQERRDKIGRLRGILIGVAIAMLLLFIIEPAKKFIEKYIEE